MNTKDQTAKISLALSTLASTITETVAHLISEQIKAIPSPGPISPLPSNIAIPDKSANGLPRLAFTMRETAEILGVSYITVHRLLQRRLLRSSKALRCKIISKTEIERFLKQTME